MHAARARRPRAAALPGRPQDLQGHQDPGGQVPAALEWQPAPGGQAGGQLHQERDPVRREAHGGGHLQRQRHRSGDQDATTRVM